jgi:phage shock protein C
MYCNACGKMIADDARFCTYCGVGVGRPLVGREMIRPRANRKIAGVCAAFGHYLDVDVTLVRILWAFVTLAAGIFPGVLSYILAWIIVPEEPEPLPLIATNQPLTTA